MVSSEEILKWGYTELSEFVNNPIAIENDRYEFKLTHRYDAKEIRKDFSSFANYKGGYLFFGINPNKKIVGIEKDDEITTFLNRALNNDRLQPPIEKWPLVHVILVTGTKPERYVYIYYIYPSIFINRPHISDGLIYVRQFGEAKNVNSGIELRRQFFLNKFYPEHIEQLDLEIEKIRNYEYQSSELDILYCRYLEQHLLSLKKVIKDETKIPAVDGLLSQWQTIKRLIDEISKLRAGHYSSSGSPSLTNPVDLTDKYNNLRTISEDFIIKFKMVHNI